jgi:DNA-binding NarL/FixJ family response regulator
VTARPIKALLIESQPLMRLGVRVVVEHDSDIELIGEADNPDDGFANFKQLGPDVTILGLRFPIIVRLTTSTYYFIEDPKAKIIVLAEHAGDAEITTALKKGGWIYLQRYYAGGVDQGHPKLLQRTKVLRMRS